MMTDAKMDAVPGSDSTKDKHPQTSTVWKYFKDVCREERTAVCKQCGDTLSYRGSVTNLKRHMQKRHGEMVVSSNGDDENQEDTMDETYLEDDDDETSYDTDDSRADKRKLRRSGVWSYFDVTDEEQRMANCRLCSEEYSYRTSSSNLAKHLKRRHHIDGVRESRLNDDDDDGEKRMGTRPMKSRAWAYFTIKDPERRTATCKLCDTEFSYMASVSNLMKHVKRRHGIGMFTEACTDQQEVEEKEIEKDTEKETENTRPIKSRAWAYFTIKDPERRTATCKLCDTEFSYMASVSNLMKHVKRKHGIGMFTEACTDQQEVEEKVTEKETENTRPIKSRAWAYFTIKDPERRTATCKLCDTEFSYMASVSNLMKHVKRKHGMGMFTEACTDQQEVEEKVTEKETEKSNHKNRSPVWLYFNKLDKRSGIAACLICKKKFKYWSSITNLKRHLERKHPHVKLDGETDSKKMMISSDGQLYEIEDSPKQEIIDDDEDDDDQDAEPMQQIYLDEIEGNVIEKATPRPVKKVKRIVMHDSNDSSDDEVTLKKRYVRKKNDTLDKFGEYLVSLLRHLPTKLSNELQADFVKQIMNCQNTNDSVRVATIKVLDDTLAVSSVSNDDAYVDVQTTIVDNC